MPQRAVHMHSIPAHSTLGTMFPLPSSLHRHGQSLRSSRSTGAGSHCPRENLPPTPVHTPVEERKSKRPPAPARQQMQIATGAGHRARMRPGAHAQTQTEVECLVGEGGANPTAIFGWRPPSLPDTIYDTRKGAERLDEGCMAKGGVASRHGGVLASHFSPSMEDVRATSRHVEQPGFRSIATDPLARQNDTCREEFYSCEGSELEGRPNCVGRDTTVEQKPQNLPENIRARVSLMVHRPEKGATSTAYRCPTDRERKGAGESPNRRQVGAVQNAEREVKAGLRNGSMEVDLSPVLAPREAATLEGDPQDHREGELEGEGCLNTPWIGSMGAGEVCRGAPLSLEQGGCQARLSPALSCVIETNPHPLLDTNVETQQQLTEEKPADDSRRDGEKQNEIPTSIGKMLDNAANYDAEVGVTACMTHISTLRSLLCRGSLLYTQYIEKRF